MIAIKVNDKKATPMVGNKIAYNHKWVDITKKDLEVVKKYVDNGRDILIKEDDKEFKGEDYFKEDKEDNNEINYEELFDAHYKKRIENIREYTNDIELLEEILTFAKENEQPNSVIEDIEEYIEELN